MASAAVEHCSCSDTQHSVLNKVEKNDEYKNKQTVAGYIKQQIRLLKHPQRIKNSQTPRTIYE
jgi:hypothetical protein